jgi:hypothetical protein
MEAGGEAIRGDEERHREIMKGAIIKAVAEMRGKPTAEADDADEVAELRRHRPRCA